MSNPLQQQTNSLLDDIRADLNRGQAKIFEALVENLEVRKLPENIFAQFFLPAFAGKVNDPSWAAKWISIAGTPSAEVDIVNDQGHVLFRVPPMISSNALVLGGKTKGRMADIFTHVGNLGLNSPQQAVGFMNSALGDKSRELQNQMEQTSNQRWYEIFTRYGMIAPEVASPTNTAEQDLFEY